MHSVSYLRGLFVKLAIGLFVFAPLSRVEARVNLHSELKGWQWHESTLLGAVSYPYLNRSEHMSIQRPGKRRALNLRFWQAANKKKPKGLYLIIPGTGGSATSGSANLLAELASEAGYDSVVLVNPFNAEFQSRFSADGLIGFPQKDVDDAALMAQMAYQKYAKRRGFYPKEVRIVGFSLGATYAGLLSQRDLGFQVQEYQLLNPPVRFQYAMDQLDFMMRDARNDDEFTLFTLLGDIIPLFRAASEGLTQQILPKIWQLVRKTEFENRNVIGSSFAITLMTITNGLKSTDQFSSREDIVRMNGRMFRMTFDRYLGLVGIALSKKDPRIGNKTFESLVKEVDLPNILKTKKNMQKVVIVTNSDDFLIENRDLKTIDGLGVKEVYVFDGGGHCGNYWTPSFNKLFNQLLKP